MKYIELEICLNFTLVLKSFFQQIHIDEIHRIGKCLNFTLMLKSIRRWVRWGKKELGTNREWQTRTHYVIIFLPLVLLKLSLAYLIHVQPNSLTSPSKAKRTTLISNHQLVSMVNIHVKSITINMRGRGVYKFTTSSSKQRV